LQIIITEQLDRGLAYAESCFETFRVIDGAIFDWPGHWSRLGLGLSEFGILLPQGCDEEVLFACLREAGQSSPDALVRLSVGGGVAGWGLLAQAVEPIIYIQTMPYVWHSNAMRLRLQTWPFPVKKKIAKFTADYADTLRALHGQKQLQILFERDQLVLATATANVAFFRDGCWFTPPSEVGVLPGRVRHFFLQEHLMREQDCPVSYLDDCEAMVVCNSGVFVQPVICVQGVKRTDPMDVKHVAIGVLQQALGEQKGVRI